MQERVLLLLLILLSSCRTCLWITWLRIFLHSTACQSYIFEHKGTIHLALPCMGSLPLALRFERRCSSFVVVVRHTIISGIKRNFVKIFCRETQSILLFLFRVCSVAIALQEPCRVNNWSQVMLRPNGPVSYIFLIHQDFFGGVWLCICNTWPA